MNVLIVTNYVSASQFQWWNWLAALCDSSPSAGTPREGRGESSLLNVENRSKALRNPHPNPLPEYRERGLSAMDAVARKTDHLTAMDSADADDIRKTLSGDGEAYRKLVRRYEQEIARKVRRFSRDPQVIEELVQETFVEAYFSLRNFRGDSPLLHWLHRIAVRVGYRYWKSKKAHPAQELTEATGVAVKETEQTHDSEELSKVLSRLSSRDLLVVTLMYLEEHSVEETARLTGWSKTMVKVQAFRARGKLRKMMQNKGAGRE